jgi:Tfp pilus assembly protein PilO
MNLVNYKNYFIATIAVISTLTAAFFYFNISNIAETKRLNSEIMIVETEKAKAMSNLGDVKAVIDDYKKKTAEISNLAKTYDSEIDYINSLEILNKLTREHNLRVDEIKPLMENTLTKLQGELNDTEHNVERYPLDVKVYGRFLDMGQFFDDLQDAGFAIRSLDINSKPNETKVSALIGLSSYRLIKK